MASIVVAGDTSGSITLAAPAIAGSNTLTLPTNTGTIITTASTGGVSQSMLASNVASNGPAFSVYTTDSSGYLNNSVATKVRFNAEIFDTANCFDTSNYRFTPNVGGFYFFTCKILNNFGPSGQLIIYLYKNGGVVAELQQTTIAQQANGFAVSYLTTANGTTDYFELYYYQDKGGGLSVYTGAQQTFWTGFLARAAV